MSLTVTLFDHTGKQIDTRKLPKAIFGLPANDTLLAQAVHIYLSSQRQGTKHAKTRGEVARSTAKIWRQKGTGRARHGSRRAPIFVGGGKAHGPVGNEHYRLHLTKRLRRQSLYTALSQQCNDGHISLVDRLDQLSGKTKATQAMIAKITAASFKPTLLILDKPYPIVLRSARNIPHLSTTQLSRLNTYEVLNHTHLIFSLKALDQLTSPEASAPELLTQES